MEDLSILRTQPHLAGGISRKVKYGNKLALVRIAKRTLVQRSDAATYMVKLLLSGDACSSRGSCGLGTQDGDAPYQGAPRFPSCFIVTVTQDDSLSGLCGLLVGI